jgi:hypothetical protein
VTVPGDKLLAQSALQHYPLTRYLKSLLQIEQRDMNHITGEEVRLGDRVKLGSDAGGIVVCSIDTDEYTMGYTEADWSHLEHGVLIDFPSYGLIHYEQADPSLEFIGREIAT